MRKIGRVFLRERCRQWAVYGISGGLMILVLLLYGVKPEAVGYGSLLAFIVLLGYEGLVFGEFWRRVQEILRSKAGVRIIPGELPEASGLLEETYQEMVRRLYEEKMELESRNRISHQELLDYYGMWVHQVKTPIAALNLLLQTDRGAEDETLYVRNRAMKMELFKIEEYVEMALNYLRMEDMSGDLALRKCSMDAIIRQVLRKYSQMFIGRGLRLRYEPLKEEILTDEKWLAFVLEQLLSNGIKYTREGGISIYMKDGELVVEDTGIGIQAEDLPRVFERGFTGYNGRVDKKSTGIGLYLCKSVMDKLGHGIRIESRVDEGTRVYLRFTGEERWMVE